MYWVTAEPVILLLCTCLPASLQLGRRVMTSYVSPIMSKVYSSLSSLGGSSQHGSVVAGNGDGVQSIRSVESNQEFIKVSPHQDYHKAAVKAGRNGSLSSKSSRLAGNGIRVDNDVSVV